MSGEILTTAEKNALLALMAEARVVSNKELDAKYGFTLTGKDRERLNDLKLVESHRVGRTYYHELIEAGWARCREELSAERQPRGNIALYAVLAGLARYVQRADVSLAELFFRPDNTIEDQILAAYRHLASEGGKEVRLAELRKTLGHVKDGEVTEALKKMHEEKSLTLIPEDDQKRLRPEDRRSEVKIGRRAYHLISIELS